MNETLTQNDIQRLEEYTKLEAELKRIGFAYDVWYDISNTISYSKQLEKENQELKRKISRLEEQITNRMF